MESKQVKRLNFVEKILARRRMIQLEKLVKVQNSIRFALSNEIGKNIAEIGKLREIVEEKERVLCVGMMTVRMGLGVVGVSFVFSLSIYFFSSIFGFGIHP
jgi:hypothetical protein